MNQASNPYASPRQHPVNRSLSVTKGFAIVIASIVAFGVAGAVLGYMVGVFAPGYYRSVVAGGDAPGFSPTQVGFGLGLIQGCLCGAVVGCVVVLAVAWSQAKARKPLEDLTTLDLD